MPIRAINDKHYKGVSELYRKSDGEVTGYYVTYRDTEGKPIKRRVDASTRDEALLQLVRIKQAVDLDKQGNTMSVRLPKRTENVLVKERMLVKPFVSAPKTIQDYQKIISAHQGVAIVSLVTIVAFDDINILYGYEIGTRIVAEMQELINVTLKEMHMNEVFSKYDVKAFNYELYTVYADTLCLFIKNDLNHRLLDLIIKNLLRVISEHKFIISDESYIHINATFGATKAESSVSLMYAQKALQEAKKYQNNYIFHDHMGKSEHIVHKVYETLINNIKEETVTPYYQGIFATSECKVPYKFESLMRLVGTDGHIISPSVFMEKSKEYRLYTQLMSQMIDKVFDVMAKHDTCMTLNLSYLDILNLELSTKLIAKIKEMKIGKRLTVELVESEQIEDIEMINEFIFSLKKLGVRIAIDDFGSGFSNFDTIINLDIDYVKLDGSLVSKIHDAKYRSILESMVSICHGLGIKVIAEYISDESIMKEAQGIGVDYLQGYHLHKPEEWAGVSEKFGVEGVHNV